MVSRFSNPALRQTVVFRLLGRIYNQLWRSAYPPVSCSTKINLFILSHSKLTRLLSTLATRLSGALFHAPLFYFMLTCHALDVCVLLPFLALPLSPATSSSIMYSPPHNYANHSTCRTFV